MKWKSTYSILHTFDKNITFKEKRQKQFVVLRSTGSLLQEAVSVALSKRQLRACHTTKQNSFDEYDKIFFLRVSFIYLCNCLYKFRIFLLLRLSFHIPHQKATVKSFFCVQLFTFYWQSYSKECQRLPVSFHVHIPNPVGNLLLVYTIYEIALAVFYLQINVTTTHIIFLEALITYT